MLSMTFTSTSPDSSLASTPNHLLILYSYACPQTFPSTAAAGGPTPGDPLIPISDEFKCLILQINVPIAQLQSPASTKLPVLAYVHGGGFRLGRIDEQHNTAFMVEQSILDAQPLVSVSIQYRLGALGYLHTPETGSMNVALNDQRNALLWLQKFVEGFGGNREQVTLFGESAGSLSICNQMLFAPPESGPLFKRVVLMSGVPGPMTALGTAEDAYRVYEMFLAKLGIKERGEEGLKALRDIDVHKLVDVTAEFTDNGLLFKTVQTEEWFGEKGGYVAWDGVMELMAKCEWVDEIVLGTTGFEVSGCCNELL
jgi:carboxylesterase type B